MAGYNLSRSIEELLDAHQGSPPSFTVKLYPDYWTLNNGSKCLYNNQMASLLDDIRAQRIPVDFLELFETAKLPFYDGCMIVELHDFRPQKATDPTLDDPHKSRVVLTPNSETLWADICLLNQKNGNRWTDQDALEVEARILLATSPPLCLDPDPHLTRVANIMLRASVPAAPASLRRKAAVMEQEDEETEKARRAKLAQFMNPKYMRPAVTAPSFRLLDAINRAHMAKTQKAAPPVIPLQSASTPAQAASIRAATPYAAGPAPTVVRSATPSARAAGTPRPGSTPAPSASTPQRHQDAKKPKMSEAGQSPRTTRASATPVPQAVPLPIPPHLQPHYSTQMGLQNSPRQSQSPRPMQNAVSAQSPPKAETRPPSAAQRPPSQPNQQAPVVSSQQPSLAPTQQAHAAGMFQAQVQGASYIAQAATAAKKAQQNTAAANINVPVSFQQAGQPSLHPSQPQAVPYQILYAQQLQAYQQQQQQHNAAQQRLAQQQQQQQHPGQSVTPVARSPMASSQGTTPQRNSPMAAANQRLTSRSPMPPPNPATQPGQTVHTPQQQANYNYAALHNQYNIAAHLRPMAHGHAPHTQMLPHHLASGGQVAGGAAGAQAGQEHTQVQAQAQAQAAQMLAAQYPMYVNYAQVQPGRMGYWPMGVGRGAPVANGQHQLPGIAGHPQQMQLGANKVVQGGVQGS